MSKYTYKAVQIDIDDAIRDYICAFTIDVLKKKLTKGYSIVEYDPIAEDSDALLFSYSMQGKEFAFADVVKNQLCGNVERVTSLKDFYDNGSGLWAYCVRFEEKSDQSIFTFRKSSQAKVAVPENTICARIKACFFNPEACQLELLKSEVFSLDRQVDCVYVDESFLILQKSQFEQIVGIQEEFKEKALEMVSQLEATNQIEGVQNLRDMVNDRTVHHRRLAKIAKNGGIPPMTSQMIDKMRQIGCTHGKELKITDDGKILIESEADVYVLLKMLGDYYKTGEISGKSYGTFAGKILHSNDG